MYDERNDNTKTDITVRRVLLDARWCDNEGTPYNSVRCRIRSTQYPIKDNNRGLITTGPIP